MTNYQQNKSNSITGIIDSTAFKIGERIVACVFMCLMSVVAYIANDALQTIARNDNRISAIETWQAVTEGNRFTSKDGLLLQQQLTTIAAKLPDRYPPTEWIENVYRHDISYIGEAVDELNAGQKEIVARLQAIEVKIK